MSSLSEEFYGGASCLERGWVPGPWPQADASAMVSKLSHPVFLCSRTHSGLHLKGLRARSYLSFCLCIHAGPYPLLCIIASLPYRLSLCCCLSPS